MADTHSNRKQQIRSRYREKRLNMTLEEFQSLNEQLLVQVKKLEMHSYRTVHLFLPIEGNREPDTYAVADWLRTTYPHIRLVLSKTDWESYRMQHVVWQDTTRLTCNRWGIPEPETGTPVDPIDIDAVFIPLLAFDRYGHRVGYGKGFYDRFLSECRPDAVKTGLSLFEPEPLIADVGDHDQQLDRCVTPYRIWHFTTV